MTLRQDHLGALAEVARLINARRVGEAHKLLAAIEADPSNPAWQRPITISILRDRIAKLEAPCSTPSSSSS